MYAILKFSELNTLPDIKPLVKFIWNDEADISVVSDGKSLTDSSSVAITLNKRLINKKGRSKIREYIYFDIINNENKETYKVEISVDDDAAMLNVRAFYRAVYFILEKTDGSIIKYSYPSNEIISLPNEQGFKYQQFKSLFSEKIQMDYYNALNQSLPSEIKGFGKDLI